MPRDYGELECPACGGMGDYSSGHEYFDEDGNWYDTHIVTCPMCLGTGSISGEATSERIREEIKALRREGYDLP